MESIDSALTASTEGMRALKISLAGLAATATLQVLVVVFSGSVALLADTIHNFADALTALPLGIAFVVARRPANKRYTYGYGRAEDLAGIFIVAVIAASSGVAGWLAFQRLQHPQAVHNIPWVIVAGLIGFAGNELVAVYRIRVGRKIGSAALVADGLHARTDGLTSLAVVVGALGVAVGFPLADPMVGLLITVAILFFLKDAARDIYRRLMDSVDPGLVEDVTRVLNEVPGVETVEGVRIRWVGHELRAEAEIMSDADLSLADAHAIAENAQHRLLHDIRRLTQATIHSNPCQHDGRDHHAETAHHFPAAGTTAETPFSWPVTAASFSTDMWQTGSIAIPDNWPWETITTLIPLSRAICWSRRISSWPFFESRLAVGSSARIRAGSFTSARAIDTLCFSPPESFSDRKSSRPPNPSAPIIPAALAWAAAPFGARHLGDQRHVFHSRKRGQQVEVLEYEPHLAKSNIRQPVSRAVRSAPGRRIESCPLLGEAGPRASAAGWSCLSPKAP